MASKGGQPGNNNAGKNKDWRNAIKWALENHERSKTDKAKALRDVATKLIDSALDGDLSAIKELGDRVDGKAAQEITGHDGGPIITEVRRVIVSASDTNS